MTSIDIEKKKEKEKNITQTVAIITMDDCKPSHDFKQNVNGEGSSSWEHKLGCSHGLGEEGMVAHHRHIGCCYHLASKPPPM